MTDKLKCILCTSMLHVYVYATAIYLEELDPASSQVLRHILRYLNKPGFYQSPNSERDSILPCAVKSSYKTGLQISL